MKTKTSVLLTMLVLATLGWAQSPPQNTNFPMIGVVRGQTLQINVVAFPPDPCYAQVGFQNSSGNPVGTTISVSLQPNQSASLAINGNSLTSSLGQRVEVLPTVVPATGIVSSCHASAEVLDNGLGITNVLVPGAVSYSSNPELGMLGVTLLQTVRLNVVAYPPDPCVGQISFLDSNGNLIGNELMSVNLNPGQATFLELPGSTVVTRLGQRAEVQPVVTPSASSGGSNACVASAEVYINGLGTTAAYFPPDPCGPTSTMCTDF